MKVHGACARSYTMTWSSHGWPSSSGRDFGSTAHEICASGHARRIRPSNGKARTTSPMAPSRTISTRRCAIVICGAMASAADIDRGRESRFRLLTPDHNDVGERRKGRVTNCSKRRHLRIKAWGLAGGNFYLSKELRDPGDLTGPVTFLLLLLIALVVIRGTEPPPLDYQKAPVTEFSEDAAMRDVREIARLPHPLASAEHERVREYIVGRLRELGTNPEVQTVIVANYDSVPSGPGAGDDAASVAAILDTIRALKADRQPRNDLRNDLIILFTDGQANGMLGAKGFLETYPALREVKVVLNFDNRGDQGPSILYQTSARDSWLVGQFAYAAPFPRGASMAVSLY